MDDDKEQRAKSKEQQRNSFRANVNKHFGYSIVVVVVVVGVCLVASSNKNSRTRHEYLMWQMSVYRPHLHTYIVYPIYICVSLPSLPLSLSASLSLTHPSIEHENLMQKYCEKHNETITKRNET